MIKIDAPPPFPVSLYFSATGAFLNSTLLLDLFKWSDNVDITGNVSISEVNGVYTISVSPLNSHILFEKGR